MKAVTLLRLSIITLVDPLSESNAPAVTPFLPDALALLCDDFKHRPLSTSVVRPSQRFRHRLVVGRVVGRLQRGCLVRERYGLRSKQPADPYPGQQPRERARSEGGGGGLNARHDQANPSSFLFP